MASSVGLDNLLLLSVFPVAIVGRELFPHYGTNADVHSHWNRGERCVWKMLKPINKRKKGMNNEKKNCNPVIMSYCGNSFVCCVAIRFSPRQSD